MLNIELGEKPAVIVQGEGYWLGTPMFLIRLNGCNLNCPWCDQKVSHNGFMYSAGGIYHQWTLEGRSPQILLTGGEPLSHTDEIEALVNEWQTNNEKVVWHIETNGMYSIPPVLHSEDTWVACSPKAQNNWDIHPDLMNDIDELKYVVDKEITPEAVGRYIADAGVAAGFICEPRFWLQPLTGCEDFSYNESIQKAREFQKQYPSLRLGIQAHKVWGLA